MNSKSNIYVQTGHLLTDIVDLYTCYQHSVFLKFPPLTKLNIYIFILLFRYFETGLFIGFMEKHGFEMIISTLKYQVKETICSYTQ